MKRSVRASLTNEAFNKNKSPGRCRGFCYKSVGLGSRAAEVVVDARPYDVCLKSGRVRVLPDKGGKAGRAAHRSEVGVKILCLNAPFGIY
jgi:hypothetical protein